MVIITTVAFDVYQYYTIQYCAFFATKIIIISHTVFCCALPLPLLLYFIVVILAEEAIICQLKSGQ